MTPTTENVTSISENNEESQSGELTIGEGASQENPEPMGQYCFDVGVGNDTFKEGIETFTLTLTSEDSCVWLGRDRALLNVQENGSKIHPAHLTC